MFFFGTARIGLRGFPRVQLRLAGGDVLPQRGDPRRVGVELAFRLLPLGGEGVEILLELVDAFAVEADGLLELGRVGAKFMVAALCDDHVVVAFRQVGASALERRVERLALARGFLESDAEGPAQGFPGCRVRGRRL